MASKKQIIDPAATSAPAGRDEPTKTVRKRGGAPKGNVNAAKDKKWTRAMQNAQALARRGRRRRLAGHLADATRMVAECGMAESPLGDRIASRLAQIEHEIGELGSVVDRVGGSGRVKRDGTLSPAYEKRLSLIREDRAELRALVDKLAEIMANAVRDPGPVEYRILNADGSDFSFGFGDGAQRPMPSDPLAADAPALPAPRARLAPHATLLDAHPLDKHDPRTEALPPPEAGTVTTTATRSWARPACPPDEVW